MSDQLKSAIVKGLTELGRVAVLAAIPLLVTMLSDGEIDWRVVGITAVIAALKALDKMIHKFGQESDDEFLEKGLVRF